MAEAELRARQRALAQQQQDIDEEVARLATKRELVAAELAEVTTRLAKGDAAAAAAAAAVAGVAASHSAQEESPSKRRRRTALQTQPASVVSASSATDPSKWQHLSEVQADVAKRRAAGQLLPFGASGRVPRVYTDGCYDMMHSGHMNAVRQAKLIAESLGGVLVVGVHTDKEIEANKGPPVMRDAERLALVCAVKWVDELIFDTPYSATLPFLDSIDADYVVHGDDISINADGTDAYGEARAAGRLKIIKRTEGVSTTDLVGRLLLLTRSHHEDAPPAPLTVGAAATAAAAAAAGGGSDGGAADARDARNAAAATTSAAGAPAADAGYAVGSSISTSGVSQFLATTWRLRQFSNGRVAAPHERIVYVDGCFDLLHAGHVAALYAARRLGDFLLVGLHDDATVNATRGQNQPICSLHERALCLLALGCVDEVILGAPLVITHDLIKSMNIHTVVGDADEPAEPADAAALLPPSPLGGGGASPHAPRATTPLVAPSPARQAVDRYAVARGMGRYAQGERTHPLRLAGIVSRIVDNRRKYEARNAKREKKELDYVENQKVYVEEL